jgi:hyperosmotically inducible protein
MKRVHVLLPAIALSAALVACDRPATDATTTGRADVPTARTDTPPATTTPPTTTTTPAPTDRTAAQKAGDAVSDSTITAEVKSALAADPQLSALKIDVDTNNGVVTLTGPAPDEQSKSRATQIAAAPKGVMRVENRLEVKSS